MTVIGIRKFDFTSKKTGATYPAVTLYCTYPMDDKRGVGDACESVFCRESQLGEYEPLVGDDIRVLYNRFGSVEKVEVLY